MTYKINNIIKEVKGIKLHDDFEIIGFCSGDLFVNSERISSNVDTTTGSLRTFNSFLLFDIRDSKNIYDLKNKILYLLDGFGAYQASLESYEIICTYDTSYSNNKFSWKTGLYNLKDQKITKDYVFLNDVSIAYYLDRKSVIVHKTAKLLGRLSLLTGEYEWELDFSGRTYFDIHKEAQNVEISKIIGVWEQQLLITTNTYELISIDTASGKINWETNNLQSKIIKQPPYNQLFSNPYLENGKIYELVGNVYYSIDLLTQAIEILWRDERKEGFLSVAHPTYTDDYIYFTGSYGNHLISNLVGVFNRSNYKLEWAEELEIEDTPEGYATLNQAPQVSDNKLYVLDCMGLLRIFEREN